MIYLCIMSKIHISEQKARKIIRSLIENHMDFDSEAVRRSSNPHLDNYFKTKVDEIDNHHEHVLMMKNQYWGALHELIVKWSEINDSNLDNERKELLRERILSIIKYEQERKIIIHTE